MAELTVSSGSFVDVFMSYVLIVPIPQQAAVGAWHVELSSADKTDSLLVLQEHLPLFHTGQWQRIPTRDLNRFNSLNESIQFPKNRATRFDHNLLESVCKVCEL